MDISHTIADPVQAFRCAIADAGMIPPDEIVADGNIHRFSPTGRRTDDAGWYVLHLDRLPAGAFGNWRDGQQQTWCAKHESRLSAVERRQLAALRAETRKQRDMEHVKRQGEAASAALARWESAQPVTRNPYLEAKGVGSYGVRAVGEVLLVPVRDSNGKLHSLQTIAADGTKRFMQGGRVRGCYHSIERPHGRVIVCEGYATGASIHEATGQAVVIAFNAGNLESVCQALRAKFPCASILVAGDDDWTTPGNPGRSAARYAALAVGGLTVFPVFKAGRPDKASDFNDLHSIEGLDAVRLLFAEALEAA